MTNPSGERGFGASNVESPTALFSPKYALALSSDDVLKSSMSRSRWVRLTSTLPITSTSASPTSFVMKLGVMVCRTESRRPTISAVTNATRARSARWGRTKLAPNRPSPISV